MCLLPTGINQFAPIERESRFLRNEKELYRLQSQIPAHGDHVETCVVL